MGHLRGRCRDPYRALPLLYEGKDPAQRIREAFAPYPAPGEAEEVSRLLSDGLRPWKSGMMR